MFSLLKLPVLFKTFTEHDVTVYKMYLDKVCRVELNLLSWFFKYKFKPYSQLSTSSSATIIPSIISILQGIQKFKTKHNVLSDKVCQWLTAVQWFSPGTPVSSTNKTDRHITEMLMKVVLSTINLNYNMLYIRIKYVNLN